MDKNIIEKKILEIESLIKRKQFIVVEQKARDIIKNLKVTDDESYNFYIKAYLLLADSLVKNIKNLKALEELERVLEIYPYEEKILLEIFELSIKLKRLPKAEASLKSIINISPENIEVRFKLINLFIEKLDYFEAIKELNILLAMNIKSLDIYRMLAGCYERMEMYNQAINYILKMQEMNDEFSNFVQEIKTLIKNSDYSNAYSKLKNIIDLKLNEDDFNESIIDFIINFKDLYISFGYRNELIENILDILNNYQAKLSTPYKAKIEKLLKELDLEIISNYFLKRNLIANFDNFDEKSVIENIILFEQYENKMDYKSLKDFLTKNDIYKYITKDYKIFLQTS